MVMGLFFLMVWPVEIWAGSFEKDDPSGTPGQWYVGDTPEQVDDDKAPIVFVHGLNSSSATWWNENDMYETAFTNGYQTAFIDLYPDKNMWDNGNLLAEKLEEIYDHFGKKVVVVAHSKGGVDTQTALSHYGASEYVERMITLSSPHHGSELADLAHSEGASWLADIIGNKNAATQSLQTGYMAYFREMTDQQPGIENYPVYTLGGTGWGPAWGSLFWGGLYLSQFGSNDGAVTVSSSRLPYAHEITVKDWTHYTIKEGNATFELFEPHLQTSSLDSIMDDTAEFNAQTAAVFHTGGKFKRQNVEAFHIEENVNAVTVQWTSSSPASNLVLYGPGSMQYDNFNTTSDHSGFFSGAYHHTITLKKPQEGLWRIQAKNSGAEAYMLNVHFDSNVNEQLKMDITKKHLPEITLHTKKDKVKNVRATLTFGRQKYGKPEDTQKHHLDTLSDKPILLPSMEKGIYHITANVKGETRNGGKFNRSIIKTIYVDKQGNIYQP